MSKMESKIQAEILTELLRLDEETGRLFWLPRNESHFIDGRHSAKHRCANWNSQFSGKEAFYTKSMNGYRQGFIFGSIFSAARVVFALKNGKWPEHHIDHINGIKDDDRPVNLRDVPCHENMRNRAVSSNSSTGVHGVSMHLGKYDAYITESGKKLHVGRFNELADAISARKHAEVKFGYHNNHGRIAS